MKFALASASAVLLIAVLCSLAGAMAQKTRTTPAPKVGKNDAKRDRRQKPFTAVPVKTQISFNMFVADQFFAAVSDTTTDVKRPILLKRRARLLSPTASGPKGPKTARRARLAAQVAEQGTTVINFLEWLESNHADSEVTTSGENCKFGVCGGGGLGVLGCCCCCCWGGRQFRNCNQNPEI